MIEDIFKTLLILARVIFYFHSQTFVGYHIMDQETKVEKKKKRKKEIYEKGKTS